MATDKKTLIIEELKQLSYNKMKALSVPRLYLDRIISDVDSVSLMPSRKNSSMPANWYSLSLRSLTKIKYAIENNQFYGYMEPHGVKGVFKVRPKMIN